MTKARFHVPSFLIGLIGFAVSLYALAEHLKHSIDGSALSCDINETVSCTKVFGSSYGEFLGLPLGALGMAYFGVVIAAAMLPKMIEVSERWIAHWRFTIASIGFVISLLLSYISYYKLHAICPVCTSIHALNAANFVVAITSFLRSRKKENFADPNAFLKLVSTSLLLATPPILVGALGPSFAPMLFGKSNSSTTEVSAQATPGPRQTVAPELLAVAKSNFVGKGEDYRKGNDDAKIVVVMFSDLQCPGCRMAATNFDAALSQYGSDRVLFVYRNYPLNSDCNPSVPSHMHPYACVLAEAARCAGQQGKFWQFKEWAFNAQDMSSGDQAKSFAPDGLASEAQTLGLDVTRFQQCLASDVEMAKIKDDAEIGAKLNIHSTPTIYINNEKFEGNWATPEGIIATFERYQK